jgi:hypothetical protein
VDRPQKQFFQSKRWQRGFQGREFDFGGGAAFDIDKLISPGVAEGADGEFLETALRDGPF